MSSLFNVDIQSIKGVGSKTADLFRKFGAPTAGALLYIYPRAYEDWTSPLSIYEACGKEKACIKVGIKSGMKHFAVRGGRHIYKFKGFDDSDEIDIVFFNNIGAALSVKDTSEILLMGKVVKTSFGGYEIVCPKIKKEISELCLKPIYKQIKGLPSWKTEQTMKNVISMLPSEIPETLPEDIINEYNLCSLDSAIRNIHFPRDLISMEKARKRLAFEELFIWQISMSMIKGYARRKTDLVLDRDFTEEFYSLLPFEPTGAQRRAVKACMEDMSNSSLAMNRLLQGDVGSGKTVVAAALAYNAVKCGYQVAVMVPTELLARQHYSTFTKLMENTNIKVDILTGNLRKREKTMVLNCIMGGISNIVIGTHALISENVEFRKLGLIITDEQHRFGVGQRAKLLNKGNCPHTLVMSATPIPRTLALIVYGDLDISVLDEVPPGRQSIDTFCVKTSMRDRVYSFIKKQIDEGHQAYIVCPGIEDSEDNNRISVESYAKELLEGAFKNYNLGVIHGKMSPYQKEQAMLKFISGEIQIIVATTVIEVGIDVPNASVMVIEGAESFGLSQLHQLRGRVGRGKCKSYCIMISDSTGEDAVKRFNAMKNINDGFKLASEDLKIRGPGEFFGFQQHGRDQMEIAHLLEDMDIVIKSGEAVKKTLMKCPDISSQELKFVRKRVNVMFRDKIGSDAGLVV